MQQVLKALLPVVLVIGLVIGVRIFLKGKAQKAVTAQKAATNQAALKVLQNAEQAASNTLAGFVIRPGLRVTKTNMSEVAGYVSDIAGEVIGTQRILTNETFSQAFNNFAIGKLFHKLFFLLKNSILKEKIENILKIIAKTG